MNSYSMLNLFLSLLKSDGVNEFGRLEDVLEGIYRSQFPIEPSIPHNEIIANVLYKTKRPVCLILIDKNEHNNYNEHFELYFLTNQTKWEDTIYLVRIFGQYAMINEPNTPKKLIKKFEEIKNENTDATEDIQAIESELSDLMKLDYKKDFDSLEAFKKSYQLKPSTSRKIRFEKNYPSEFKQDIPKSSTISKSSNGSYYIKHSNGTRSKLPGILKTRKNNGRASVPAPTPRTSPINNSPLRSSPINNSPPRTNKPTYMGWFFHKTPKKKTVRNLGPGHAMRELMRRTQEGWKKEKINP